MDFRLHNPVHPVHRCFISSIHDLPRVKRQSQGPSEGIDRQSTIHQSVSSCPFVEIFFSFIACRSEAEPRQIFDLHR